jgi:hypothetical protein
MGSAPAFTRLERARGETSLTIGHVGVVTLREKGAAKVRFPKVRAGAPAEQPTAHEGEWAKIAVPDVHRTIVVISIWL